MDKSEDFSPEEAWQARKPRPGPGPNPPLLGTPPKAPPLENKAVLHGSGQIQIRSATTSPEGAKAVDKDGQTPLYNAARVGLVDINKGANVKRFIKAVGLPSTTLLAQAQKILFIGLSLKV